MRDSATDSSLLERAREGDQTAFRHLVERYEDAIAMTVAGMLGPSSEIDDVVQEVFIRFYHALESFRGDSQVGTYLHRIAINRSIDALRRRKRMRRRFFSSEESAEPFTDESPSLENRERRRLVRSAVEKLPEKYRSVVVLRMIREYSTEETAQILDIPYGTVLSRLSRAHERLRKALGEEEEEEEGEGDVDDRFDIGRKMKHETLGLKMDDDMRRVGALLRETAAADAAAGMTPLLADRVMRRIAAERTARAPEEEFWQGLVWIFRPAAALCLLLVFVLTVHNLYLSSQYEMQGSMVDAVLALPEVNTAAAYQLDLTSYEQPAL